MTAFALAGTANGEISGGTFSGGVSVGSNGRVSITGASIGQDVLATSVFASGETGTAIANISSGTFSGNVVAAKNSQVSITSGSFGQDANAVSVRAGAAVGTAIANISDGTFPGYVIAGSNSRMRISGGSFGQNNGGVFAPFPLSVDASAVAGTADVDIFGGTFSAGMTARKNATIDVYGTGLAIGGGFLTGTLADGTPINAPVATSDNGQIILHDNINEILLIQAGFNLLTGQVGTSIKFPIGLVPPEPDCLVPSILTVEMVGVQLGQFDFGEGFQDVGTADTIVRRTTDARNPGGGSFQDTIPIELVALQLASVEPVDLTSFGLSGMDTLFLTLQSDRGRHRDDPVVNPLSTGQMTMDFGMRSYESFLDVFFDIRAGSLSGPIIFSSSDTIESTPVPWSVDVPPEALLIRGVNDNFSAGVIGGSLFGFEQRGQLLQIQAATVTIPEPSTLILSALAFVGLLTCRRRRA